MQFILWSENFSFFTTNFVAWQQKVRIAPIQLCFATSSLHTETWPMNHTKPVCWIIHVRVIIRISLLQWRWFIEPQHDASSLSFRRYSIIIIKLQINILQKSTNCLTPLEVLTGPIIFLFGRCNVGLTRRDMSGFITLSFEKSSGYNSVVRNWSRDGLQHTQLLSISLKSPANTPVHLKLFSVRHEAYVWVEV